MSSNNPPSQLSEGTKPDTDTSAPKDACAEIIGLVRGSTSQPQFLSKVLRCVARQYSSPYAAIHVRYSSEVVQDDWHTGPTDPAFWKSGLQQFLTESLTQPRARARLLRAKTGGTRIAFMSAPIFDPSGPAIGAIALVLAPVEENELSARLAGLEAIARLASFSAEYIGMGRSRDSRTAGRDDDPERSASERALARAADYTTPKELAFAITNDLCGRLECEQVALGLVVRGRVKVLAISGLDTVHTQSPGGVSLRAAMEECLDADGPIVAQAEGGWSSSGSGTGYRLHRQWHKTAQGDAVASIPLHAGDRCTAILSLRKRSGRTFKPDQLTDVRKRVEPFAAALMLLQKASQNLVRHVVDSAGGAVAVLTRPGRVVAKVLTLALSLLALSFLFGSIDYELAVPCIVTPAHVRHVTAPIDGILQTTHVVAGDHITRGQALCEFDHRELDQQRAELLAELGVMEREKDWAIADDSPVEVQLALAKQELLRARLDIVNRRLGQAVVRAPFDGVVVAGDLRRQVGGVLARGDPLFEVAPRDDWTLELEVPESASEELKTDLAGFFATYARPDQTVEFQIVRVLSEAQVRGSRNVYVAEAEISVRGDGLRPGMEGVAKVRLGPRRIWWITLHRAIDYLRMHFWL